MKSHLHWILVESKEAKLKRKMKFFFYEDQKNIASNHKHYPIIKNGTNIHFYMNYHHHCHNCCQHYYRCLAFNLGQTFHVACQDEQCSKHYCQAGLGLIALLYVSKQSKNRC